MGMPFASHSKGDRRGNVAGVLSHATPLVYGGVPNIARNGRWELETSQRHPFRASLRFLTITHFLCLHFLNLHFLTLICRIFTNLRSVHSTTSHQSPS